MRIAPPAGGTTPFDHQPETWRAFRQYYGTLWSEGIVDEPTKEVGRLRNARVTGCGICKNLRFAGARAAGLSEDLVDRIDADFEGPRAARTLEARRAFRRCAHRVACKHPGGSVRRPAR